MKPTRFVIEGTWSGYTSAQTRVVHRAVHSVAFKRLRKWAESAGGIRFTDGTSLLISVRDCKPRERVQEIRGYSSLIDDCAHFDVRSVDAVSIAREDAIRRMREDVVNRRTAPESKA